MTFPEMVDLLKTGGPYTLVVAIAWMARHFYMAREADREKAAVEKQQLNERIIKIVEGQNDILAKSIDNQRKQAESLQYAVDNQHLLLEAMKAVQLPR